MSNQLTVKPTNQYGMTVLYPACDLSMAICQAAGTKTLTHAAIRAFQAIDASFELVAHGQRIPTDADYLLELVG